MYIYIYGEWATLPLVVFSEPRKLHWSGQSSFMFASMPFHHPTPVSMPICFEDLLDFVGMVWDQQPEQPVVLFDSFHHYPIPYRLTMVTTCLPTTSSGWPISQQFYLPIIPPYSTYFHGLNMLKHWGIVSDRRAAERAWCTSPGAPGEVLLGQWVA